MLNLSWPLSAALLHNLKVQAIEKQCYYQPKAATNTR